MTTMYSFANPAKKQLADFFDAQVLNYPIESRPRTRSFGFIFTAALGLTGSLQENIPSMENLLLCYLATNLSGEKNSATMYTPNSSKSSA